MSTINYGGTNRNVYYVDATMTDNTGDGLTPQTAFKDLSASSLVDNSVYIFRRTPKSSYSTVSSGTASQVYNIIFMGMPISSDKMYAIIPQEAKDAWNTDEEDNNESHASVFFNGKLHLNNADDVSLFRIRVLHADNNNDWSLQVGIDLSSCAYSARNLAIEKCEFTNVNNSLETTPSTFNTNYFSRYIWYSCFNVSMKECDIEANYVAFSGYSHISNFEDISALMSQHNENSSWSGNYMIEDSWNDTRMSLHRWDNSDNMHGGESFVKNIHVRWRYNSSWFSPVNVIFLSKNFSLENFTVEEAESHIALPTKFWPPGTFIRTHANCFKMKNIRVNLPKEQGRGIFYQSRWRDYNTLMESVGVPIKGNYNNKIENVYIRYFNYGDDKSTFISCYNGTFDPENFGVENIHNCNSMFYIECRKDMETGRPVDLILGDRTNDHEAGYIIAPYAYGFGGSNINFEADEVALGCVSVAEGMNIHIGKLYTTASADILRLHNGNERGESWSMGQANCVVDELVSYQLTGSPYTSSAVSCYDRIMCNLYVGKSNVKVIPLLASLARRGHCTITCANDAYTGSFVSRSAYTTVTSWTTIYGGLDKTVLQFKQTSGDERAWIGRSPFHLFGVTPTTAGLKYVWLRMSKVGFTVDKELQYIIRMNVTQNKEKISDGLYAIITPDANWHYGNGYNIYIPVDVVDTTNDIYVDFNYTGKDDTGVLLLHPEIELVDEIPELVSSSSSGITN